MAAPHAQLGILPRLLRLRDAPFYLGMDRNRFNAEVRPFITEIPIGEQGIAFDRVELDVWVDEYKTRNGRPAAKQGGTLCHKVNPPGLRKRGGIWHIQKRINKQLIRESTGTSDLQTAKEYLAKREQVIYETTRLGLRPQHTFDEATERYLREHMHKRSISEDARNLKQLRPFIGHLSLDEVTNTTVAPYIKSAEQRGNRPKTINNALGVVRQILNLAASDWTEGGHSWLTHPPRIRMRSLQGRQRVPYPLSAAEQRRLFETLPPHLARMALFKVNTGTREEEVCQLRWDWEHVVSELKNSVFIVPGSFVKNGEDRLVVLNRVARRVIESCRNLHDTHVFSYNGHPVTKMNNSAWKRAWRGAGLPVTDDQLRGVHNLKHTFGRRLRAAGVRLETRKVLLGHKNGDITTHYSAPEVRELIDASDKVADQGRGTTLMRAVIQSGSKNNCGCSQMRSHEGTVA